MKASKANKISKKVRNNLGTLKIVLSVIKEASSKGNLSVAGTRIKKQGTESFNDNKVVKKLKDLGYNISYLDYDYNNDDHHFIASLSWDNT